MLVNSKESCIPPQSQCFGLGGGRFWGVGVSYSLGFGVGSVV